MKKNTNQGHLFNAVLIAWFVLSAAYIAHDLWKSGAGAAYSVGYDSGYRAAFTSVVNNSQRCEPFNVFVGDASVNLVNVACLQQAAQAAQAGSTANGDEALLDDGQ